MDAAGWDDRYAARDQAWSVEPNIWVEQLTADLPPGRALDLAAGEGRNALWLAERGWDVTAVDFSSVALERARRLAADRLGPEAGSLTTVHADLLGFEPPKVAYDLVLLVYLHLPELERRRIVRGSARAVAPSGRLLVVGHDRDNLAHGIGGPQDPAVLYSPSDIEADLQGTGLTIDRAESMSRPVETDEGTARALDTVVLAHRPRV
ncbi:MAG: class I SAM-dependent methyltransferase [Actinomycetota bacterium]